MHVYRFSSVHLCHHFIIWPQFIVWSSVVFFLSQLAILTPFQSVINSGASTSLFVQSLSTSPLAAWFVLYLWELLFKLCKFCCHVAFCFLFIRNMFLNLLSHCLCSGSSPTSDIKTDYWQRINSFIHSSFIFSRFFLTGTCMDILGILEETEKIHMFRKQTVPPSITWRLIKGSL